MPSPGRRPTAIAALALCSALLAGCSGSSESSADSAGATSSNSAAAGGAANGSATQGEVSEDSAGGSGADPGTTTTVETSDQKLARSASISLQVEDIPAATATVRAISASAAAFVLSENIGSYGRGDDAEGVNPTTYAAISISVPVDRLDATLDELEGVGTVLDRHSETENVTAEYVDVQARVESMGKSVDRVQALIDDTADIDQLVKLERELSSRQADLEAIQARLNSLERSTARSPITITMTTRPELIDELDNPADGFLGGLAAGWNAFVSSLVALMTVLGAVLPFALFALLIGWPLLLGWRRWRTYRDNRPPRPRPTVPGQAQSPVPVGAGVGVGGPSNVWAGGAPPQQSSAATQAGPAAQTGQAAPSSGQPTTRPQPGHAPAPRPTGEQEDG